MSNDIVRLTCAHENCGTFAMDRALRDKLKKTGETFTCPGGHPQHFGETLEAQIRSRIDDLESEVARLETRLESAEETIDYFRASAHEEGERRRDAESELLDRVNGVVEIGDSWMWACECGSSGHKQFEEEKDAENALDRHRGRVCEVHQSEVSA